MKTVEEVEAKLKELFTDADDIKVRVVCDKYEMDISAMYECPGRDLKKLVALGEFLGTMDIEEAHTVRQPGCETCDFGSKYGVVLTAPAGDAT